MIHIGFMIEYKKPSGLTKTSDWNMKIQPSMLIDVINGDNFGLWCRPGPVFIKFNESRMHVMEEVLGIK